MKVDTYSPNTREKLFTFALSPIVVENRKVTVLAEPCLLYDFFLIFAITFFVFNMSYINNRRGRKEDKSATSSSSHKVLRLFYTQVNFLN